MIIGLFRCSHRSMQSILKSKGLNQWPRRAFLIPTSLVLLLGGCQQRKPADVDPTVPSDKNGYTPQRGPGDGAGGGIGGQGPTNLGGPSAQSEVQLLNGWDGSSDKLANGWSIVHVPITNSSPPPSSSGSSGGSTSSPGGSSPGSLPQGSAGAKVTYSVEIKPLLDKYCVSCHSVGGSRATSPLTSYPSLSIATQSSTKVANGTMPKPGSPQMTPAEKELFAKWAANGHAQ